MRRILIVIDMQHDFIDGALGTEQAMQIVPNVLQKIQEYAPENRIATRDTHGPDYLQTSEGQHLPVPHCIRGTKGWEIVPEISAALGDTRILDKPSFGSPALAHFLAEENKKEPLELELVGLCTDICVVSNALLLKAALPETRILVDASCCAGVTPDTHQAALTTMKMCQVEICGMDDGKD